MTKRNLKFFSIIFLISFFIFSITGCSNNSEDALSSSRSYNVNFAVTDENEKEVAAADLTFAGEKKTTDAKGLASFKRANGEYDYEVSAEGYKNLLDSIVVNGEDSSVDIKLFSSDPGGSEPGDTDDTTDPDDPGDVDNKDTTAPVLTGLYAWINGDFYGLDIGLIEGIIDVDKDLDQNYDYLILLFSEKVKVKEEAELKEVDFETQITSVNPNQDLKIIKAVINSELLMLKVDKNDKLNDDGDTVRARINESGRQKIFDLAGNMLAENPDIVELEIKK